jgi:hypothetical protein
VYEPHYQRSGSRLGDTRAEHRENRDGEEELQAGRERTGAVPAVVVEEFPSTRAQEREDVLEVGGGARYSAECRRIERASSRGEEEDACEAAADLEPTRVEVAVRNAVAGDVENRPQKECREPRAAGGSGRSARRNVEGNDHAAYVAECRHAVVPVQARSAAFNPQELAASAVGSSCSRRKRRWQRLRPWPEPKSPHARPRRPVPRIVRPCRRVPLPSCWA